MPKVVHIIHESRGGGGMTIALAYFHRYLAHFDTVAITGNLGPLPDKLREQGVRAYGLPLDRLWSALASIPRIAWILRREKPDLVILHGQWGGFCGAVASWLARVRRVLYYTHMPSFYTDWDFHRMIRNRIVESICCGVATRVVCLSQAGRYQYLLRHLSDEEKFVHIPNGVDTEVIRPVADKAALRRELNLPVEGPLVVSVGRLEDQKRVDWLVRAWSLVEKEFPAAHLAIVGDGRQRAALETLARELGLRRCHFLGKQPDGYRYFQAADAAALTSMFEGHPVALLEAMAAGCPVVATTADGVPETMLDGVTGHCVPVADCETLAKKIILLLNQPDQANRLAQAARQRAENHFALQPLVEQQLQLAGQFLTPI